jgi:hypothetical protein
MITPSAALLAILTGTAGITAIVANRVFVRRVPQGASSPHILIIPVTGRSEDDLLEVGGQHTYRVTVEARSGSSLEADDLGNAICAALDNFTGTSAGLAIDRIRRVSEAFLDDEATQTFRRAIDFYVYYA